MGERGAKVALAVLLFAAVLMLAVAYFYGVDLRAGLKE